MSISASTLSVACSLCGADCEAKARFCPFCGSPIGTKLKGDDALTGESLSGGWCLEERIGVDALGRLFRATRGPEDPLTVCVIHDHLARNTLFSKNFLRASAQAKKIRHPGVLSVKSAGAEVLQGKERLLVISEAFEGRTLPAIVQARGLLPISQTLLIIEEVIEALGGAHRQGVVHGDLLPENIIIGITDDGAVRAKVASFALSRLASVAVPRLCCGGTASGTGIYRAPEVIRGEEPSTRSDLYSVGVLLFEQLTGKRPFCGFSCLDLESRHLHTAPQPVATFRAMGRELESLVLHALEKRADQRFSSAAEMLRALKVAKEQNGQNGESTGPSSFPWSKRKLIGREKAVDALHATGTSPVVYGKEDLGHPRGTVTLLIGGAGAGKTAIIQHVLCQLEASPIATMTVQGRRAISRPLQPFTALVGEAIGLRYGSPKEKVDQVHQSLVTQHGVDPDEAERLIDRITGRVSSLRVSLDILEREQTWTLRSFIGKMVASRPTLLVIEDVDAMDTASLELTKDLMEASATLAMSVIVTTRSDPWPQWDVDHVSRITIGHLEAKEAAAMLEASLQDREASPEAKALAVTWSKGLPLLLDLIARAMRSEASIIDPEGNLKMPSTSKDYLGGLRLLVSTGLKQADPIVHRWLSCASVAGRWTLVDLLESFASPYPDRQSVVEACCKTGLVRCQNEVLMFANEGVRDVVRTLIPDEEERSIHRFIASWLRDRIPRAAPWESIAEHLLASGEQREAARLFEIDALDLLCRDQSLEAASLLARAQRIHEELRDDTEVVRVGLKRVEALLAAGDGKKAADALARIEAIKNADNQDVEGLRARVVASIAAAQGNWDRALLVLERASEAALERLDQRAWYEVETSLAEELYKRHRLEDAKGHAMLALELAMALADSQNEGQFTRGARIARACTFLSKIRIEMNQGAEARDVLKHCLGLAHVRDDVSATSGLLASLAYAHSEAGEIQESLKVSKLAFDLARKAGDRMTAARIAINTGAYELRLGKNNDAHASFTKAKALARAVGWTRGVRLAKAASRKIRNQSENQYSPNKS